MKNNLRLLTLGFMLLLSGLNSVGAQCIFNDNLFPDTPFTPTSATFTAAATNIYGGEYSIYNVIQGNTYEWSLCAADGGAASYDSQLSLFDPANTSFAIAYGDDDCGDDAKITWVATYSGQVYVQVNLFNCLTNTVSSTLVYRLAAVPVVESCLYTGDLSQYPAGIFTPTSNVFTAVATNIFAGEHSRYNVTAGQTYEWSLCAADGGSATYDSQLSMFASTNTFSPIAYSDDFCGDDAKITWTATFTGIVYVQVNQFDCTTNAVNTTLVYRRVSGASVPSNDNCATATNLTVNQFCSPTGGTLLNATASSPATACLGTNTDDVWYAFTVNNATQTLNFEITPNGTGFDPVFEIFTGINCTNLTSLLCVNNGGDGVAEGFFASPGVVPVGTTFYIRVYDFNAGVALNPNFTVCAFYSDEFIIPGDECDNAINIGVTTTCTNPVLGNYGDFTLSNGLGFDCQQTIVSDVWYSFDAISD
jgi:UDP-2,3-diacylglucosamine pyrophosphatase LpxH